METDIWPRRNLPDLAEEWGRQQEVRTDENTRALESLQLSVSGANRANASSLESIARQVQAIEENQSALAAQQITLAAQQDALAAQQASLATTVAFLQTQTQYASNGNMTSYTGSNSGVTWRAFDPTYDVSMNITTGSSGVIVATMSGLLTGVTFTGLFGIEVVGVSGPSYGVGSAFSTDGTSTPSRPVSYNLSPNTNYTVRMRRGIDGTASGLAVWGFQALTVTRLG